MSRFRTLLVLCAVSALGLSLFQAPPTCAADDAPKTLALKNDHVLRELALIDGVWRTVRIARADGTDELKVDSDEFHILPMEGNVGLTIADYRAAGDPVRSDDRDRQTVTIK